MQQPKTWQTESYTAWSYAEFRQADSKHQASNKVQSRLISAKSLTECMPESDRPLCNKDNGADLCWSRVWILGFQLSYQLANLSSGLTADR